MHSFFIFLLHVHGTKRSVNGGNQDFVLPKFGKTKRYVICPMIDMANHKSPGWDTTFTAGEVAFEYFSNAYSLAGDVASSLTSSSSEKTDHRQLYISYGSRSNDQLLQYYGFVETNNPHDVYIMPALRTWDIGALEVACGRSFAPGRLEKLDRAGLLGRATNEAEEDYSDIDGDESAARVMKNNANGGVVLNRSVGIDPAVLQALRALVSTDKEWDAAGQAIGNFSTENSGGFSNEQCARLVGRIAIEMELASKATTLEQDEELLQRMNLMKSLDSNPSERLAIQFRIEKKKLLREAIARLT